MLSNDDESAIAQLTSIDPRARLRRRVNAVRSLSQPSRRTTVNNEPDSEEVSRRLCSLSARQLQVLLCVYEGQLNKAIADQLGISVKTVELHRARMMKKMRAGSAADLIRWTSRCADLLGVQ